MIARRARADDAAELVRLRAVLLRTFGNDGWNDDWCETARQTLARRLAEPEPTMAAFVVDRPGGGLAACAVGTIEERLGTPADPGGRCGYIFNVATDPDQRRRGYSRLCVTALLDWFRSRDIGRIDLRASPDGEPLYLSLGFERTTDPAMRLRLS
jgi:GNAT superfamily N-acetyltransferase